MQDNNDLEMSKIEQLSNSLQLLYLKIKNGEAEVSQISLLNIIEDYLKYLLVSHSKSVNLEIVANFLITISELILWKSSLLLPSLQNQIDGEIEEDTELLKEDNWVEYKKYQSLVNVLLEKEFKQREIFFTCPGSINDFEEISKTYDFSELILAFESMLIKNNKHNVIDIKDYELNIENKMREIEEMFLKNDNKFTFSQLINENCPKIEIIIIFLSLLQLICQKKVDYMQTQNFGEIIFYRKEDKKLKKENAQLL